MSFYYDDEVPAGYQDADIEMAEYEAEARRGQRLRAEGVCLHSSTLGRGDGNGPLPGGFYYEGQETIPPGAQRCTEPGGCGTLFLSDDEYDAEVRKAWNR